MHTNTLAHSYIMHTLVLDCTYVYAMANGNAAQATTTQNNKARN